MPHITIISSSVRTGRKSHRVALFFNNYIEQHQLASVQILDLMEYQFPVFNERLSYQNDPSDKAKEVAEIITRSDAVLIVTPEYNGGYPASLKNFIDLLYSEWNRKPVGIATVSKGSFGGSQVIIPLQFTLWKMHALVAPVMFPVSGIADAFSETGAPADPDAMNKRAEKFITGLLWLTEAVRRMSDESVA